MKSLRVTAKKANNTEAKNHLASKEAQKTLKISGCDLKHMREEGKLGFEKKGNAYFYSAEDIDKQKKQFLK